MINITDEKEKTQLQIEQQLNTFHMVLSNQIL